MTELNAVLAERIQQNYGAEKFIALAQGRAEVVVNTEPSPADRRAQLPLTTRR